MLFFLTTISCSQDASIVSVAFYNTENLFDAEDNPTTFDDDYTPEGSNHWTAVLLNQKVNQIADVISKIGTREIGQPPILIGLVEIENKKVLQELIHHPILKPFQYDYVHFDSSDARGIDVALLYRKELFIIEKVKRYPLFLTDPNTQFRRTTRDQLVVSGFLENNEIAVLVNHWPSRRGGQRKSEGARLKASQLQLKILDSLQRDNPDRYLISMGDFNDNPTNKSLFNLTTENDYRTTFIPLVNPMKSLFKKGVGSLAYRDRWHLFDQILVSQDRQTPTALFFVKAVVYSPSFLRTPNGKYKGYPFRTKVEGEQLLGYSDHFPVYILLGRK